jgi:catechol 2,3-dioxygenase-like lactoylglutathione lyase family enzyme
MLLNLTHIGQIALPVADVDRSEAFYRDVLGLPKQYRFGDLTFFDCAGVRSCWRNRKERSLPGLHLLPLRGHRAYRR